MKTVEKALGELDHKRAVILKAKPVEFSELNTDVLVYAIEKLKGTGICVTLNTPSKNILAELEKMHVDSSEIFFIDSTGEKVSGEGNRLFLSSYSLVELSIAITELINKDGFNFLIFNSLSALLIYNDAQTAAKFVAYLVNKLRNSDVNCIFLSVDEEKSNNLIGSIAPYVDKVVEV